MAVDDDEDFLYIVKKILEREGYCVETVTNGWECLRRIEKSRPDLLILDVVMPGLDGLETCKRVKEDPDTCSIPVLILSIRREREDVERSIEYAGADSHLAKPVEIQELVRKVRELTGGVES